MSAHPVQLEQAKAHRVPGRRWARYLTCMGLVPLLLYPLPFLLVRAPLFEQWSTSPFGRDLEYGMTATHVDADVVIYGDSTALYGPDPRQMSAELGVKVFNIPSLLPTLRVTGDLALRRYLAANKTPRLIVFYLSPWDLDYGNSQSPDALYDGDEMMLRHGSAREIWTFYRTHPTEYMTFPFMFYRTNSLTGLGRLLRPHDGAPGMAVSAGHRDKQDAHPLAADCSLPPSLPSSPAQHAFSMDSAKELLAGYDGSGLRAIVYVAPIPGCRNAGEVASADYSALHTVGPRLLPPQAFARDGYYAHPLAGHVGEVTGLLVEAIRPLLRRNP